MAKQRRPQPRPGRASPQAPVNSVVRPTGAIDPPASKPAQPTTPPAPQRRSTYFEAVAVYERGLEALQRHEYESAPDLFESVLRLFPGEKELHERGRLYMNICQRQAKPREASPQTVDERLYAATLAINGGQYDQALAHPRRVGDEDPDKD